MANTPNKDEVKPGYDYLAKVATQYDADHTEVGTIIIRSDKIMSEEEVKMCAVAQFIRNPIGTESLVPVEDERYEDGDLTVYPLEEAILMSGDDADVLIKYGIPFVRPRKANLSTEMTIKVDWTYPHLPYASVDEEVAATLHAVALARLTEELVDGCASGSFPHVMTDGEGRDHEFVCAWHLDTSGGGDSPSHQETAELAARILREQAKRNHNRNPFAVEVCFAQTN